MREKVGLLLCCSIFLSCFILGESLTHVGDKSRDVSIPPEAKCELCELIVAKIEPWLQNNQSEAEILNFLTKECDHLINPDLVTSCQYFVTQYINQLIMVIQNEKSPQQACTDLGVCVPPKKEKVDANPAECQACDLIVKQAQTYLSQNLTESVILSLITKDCSFLILKNLIQTCTKMVTTDGKEILHLLSTNVSPDTVCSTLQFCSPSRVYHLGTRAECAHFCKCDTNSMEQGKNKMCNDWGGNNPDVIPHQSLSNNCWLEILGSGYFTKQLCLDAFENIFQQCGGGAGDFYYDGRNFKSSCDI